MQTMTTVQIEDKSFDPWIPIIHVGEELGIHIDSEPEAIGRIRIVEVSDLKNIGRYFGHYAYMIHFEIIEIRPDFIGVEFQFRIDHEDNEDDTYRVGITIVPTYSWRRI